jgi:hypothetical protein
MQKSRRDPAAGSDRSWDAENVRRAVELARACGITGAVRRRSDVVEKWP